MSDELVARLRTEHARNGGNGDCGSANPPVISCPMQRKF